MMSIGASVCGQSGWLECHHVRPLDRGGQPYAMHNLKVPCRECHIDHHQNRPLPTEQTVWKKLVSALVGG